MSIRHIQQEQPPPAPVAEPNEDFVNANEAYARSMPVHRLLDNGVTYADAISFHQLARANVPWAAVGEWLGDRNMARARASLAAGFERSAIGHLLHGCACFRFAQSVYTFDDDEKRRLYGKVIDTFSEATPLLEYKAEKLEIPCRDGALCGWLLSPEAANPPVVVIFGGADGWRESYYTAGLPLLREGIAICLLDGPGQGESRIFRNLYLTRGFADDFATVIRHLAGRKDLSEKVGVFGNSLGGTLAAAVAAHCKEVTACCVNGGSIAPAVMADRFPRVLDRVGAMMGTDDRDLADAMLGHLDLHRSVHKIQCPVLVLHGGADPLFPVDSAIAIHDGVATDDRTMIVWDDGDHCVYNHAFERNALTAEWFAGRLK